MPTAQAMRERLLDVFTRSPEEPLDDAAFDDLARAVFAWQFEHNAPLSAYWRTRRATPETIAHWSAIPAVPGAAFKEVALVAGDIADAQATFRTSGTTTALEKRGVHHVLDLELYHAALLSAFRAWVVPDHAKLRMLSLMPPATELPDSSLATMIDTVLAALGDPESRSFATVAAGLDDGGLDRALHDAMEQDVPVCLLGTSLAFVHWLDLLAQRNATYRLPSGSRLMDTGGFKGQHREVTPADLRGRYRDRLGIPADACVNEYGMTEMLSQFYDSTLRRDGPRRKIPPPWVRTRIVDPDTLEPIDQGTGLLQHFDLANVGSVIAIQTEDIGVHVADGFEVVGRAIGATPRGCSIAMDLLLEAARD